MAKYDSKRRPTPSPRCGIFKHMGIALGALVVGYGIGSLYDFTTVMQWIHQYGLNNSPVVTASTMQKEALPKPKFEFYTLLTQDSHSSVSPVSSTPHAAVAVSPPTTPAETVVATRQQSPEAKMMTEALSEPDVVEAIPAATEPISIANKDAYLVQLASFRRPQDAEKMKATLSLKGFTVSIMAVNQQHTQWYRVVLGPYASKFDAQRAQSAIAKSERIAGMIRKMDA